VENMQPDVGLGLRRKSRGFHGFDFIATGGRRKSECYSAVSPFRFRFAFLSNPAVSGAVSLS
jgi:hypothetical protein